MDQNIPWAQFGTREHLLNNTARRMGKTNQTAGIVPRTLEALASVMICEQIRHHVQACVQLVSLRGWTLAGFEASAPVTLQHVRRKVFPGLKCPYGLPTSLQCHMSGLVSLSRSSQKLAIKEYRMAMQ